jgi:hypothetical protein
LRFISSSISSLRRRFALLAPHSIENAPFRRVAVDSARHAELLSEAQRLRGAIAVQEGALHASELGPEGRHVQTVDYKSWHLLTVDDQGRIAACMRYLPHAIGAKFSDLLISHTSLAQCAERGGALRSAVEAELASAHKRRCSYVEMGGWVINEPFRCTSEALRMVLSAYGLAQLFGGALGISTATTQRCSSSILKRIGGERLMAGGQEVMPYYDSQYRCEMEVIRFDSRRPNPRYRKWVEYCSSHLRDTTVVCPDLAAQDLSGSLERLAAALEDRPASSTNPPRDESAVCE